MLPIPFQNYSVQPACEIWRCGTQGDNSVRAASWSTLHEQWGKKLDGWCGDREGWQLTTFFFLLHWGFLVCSSNIICRLSFSRASFLNSNHSGICGFYYMGDYSCFHSTAHSVLVALILHGGISYVPGSGLILSLLRFVAYLFLSSTALTRSRGLGGAGKVWKTGG